MNKSDIRKHADTLANGAIDCIRAVLVKHNMGIIEGAAESVAQAVAAEREACAKVCDREREGGLNDNDELWADCAEYLATAIRALGKDDEAVHALQAELEKTGGFCGTCKYRDDTGHCTSQKLDEDTGQNDDKRTDMLVYDYSEGGGFWVGEKFGCVHYE